MKEYKVLKAWKGSPTGAETISFKKDEVVPLPDSLAEVALKEKWVSVVKAQKKDEEE